MDRQPVTWENSALGAAENIFPFLRWLKSYSIYMFLQDALAGASLASILIPQAMSYALLAMLPPVFGLYSTVFSALAHLVFGVSPFQSLGPFALVSLMTGNAIMSMALRLENGVDVKFQSHALQDDPWVTYPILIPLSEILTVSVSILMFLMFLTKSGKLLKNLLPDPLIKGFTVGAAISIVTSQLKLLFGVQITPITGTFIVIRTWWAIICALPESFQIITMAIGLSTMGVIVCLEYLEDAWTDRVRLYEMLRRRALLLHFYRLASSNDQEQETATILTPTTQPPGTKPKAGLPKILLSLILMTSISYVARVNEKYSTSLMGVVQSGLPQFNSPFRILGMISDDSLLAELLLVIFVHAMSISLVGYVTMLSIIQTFPSPLLFHEGDNEAGDQRVRVTSMALQDSPNRPASELQEDLQTLLSPESGYRNVNEHIPTQSSDESVPPSNTIVAVEPRTTRRRRFLKKWDEEDNELLAMSLASLLCSFCSGYVSSGSLSRSAILSKLDSKSPLANATASIFVTITVFFLTDLIYWVPLTCLAAVIIFSLLDTIQKIGPQARKLWTSAKEKNGWREWRDLSLWTVTFLAVVLFDPLIGIMGGMFLALVWMVLQKSYLQR